MSAEPLIDQTESSVLHWVIKRLTLPRVIYSAFFGAVFSLLSWLLPKYFAYLYMRYFGFYDYEFMDSSLANSIVTLNFFIMLPAFVGLGLLAYFIKKLWPAKRLLSYALIIVLILELILISYAAYSAPLMRVVLLFGLVATIVTSLYSFFERKKNALMALVILSIFSIASLPLFRESFVFWYADALKQNGLGGFLADIELVSPLNSTRINFPAKDRLHHDGKLLQVQVALIAPSNIYITSKQLLRNTDKYHLQSARAIIPKNNVLIITPHSN